eukprot:TRINITY_DN2298_c0_g1_i2.p1 TRINITY_DN2298_c0_g1~~TRINITY_DN2298_c0_g1_i2.p1  ORF type:complete len:184 (-),score=78.09 TRINITY_DN2298_c0_g1_i2:154-705(-)
MLSLYNLGRGRRAEEKKAEGEQKQVVTAGSIRIQTDMEELELPANCKLNIPNREDLMNFKVDITPDDGYWKDGTFTFAINVPDNYPHRPPKVLCETKVYHPNINLQGNVCLNILRDDWRPILNIQNVIHGLIFLFLDPNPDDPLNQEAAAVLRRDKAQFKQFVDASLRGRSVQGVDFPRNPTI